MPTELSLEDKDSNSNDNQHLNQSSTSIGSNNGASSYQTNEYLSSSSNTTTNANQTGLTTHSSPYTSMSTPSTSTTPHLPHHTVQVPQLPTQMKIENDFNNNTSSVYHQNGQAYGGFLDCSTPGIQPYGYNSFPHQAAAAAAVAAAAGYSSNLLPNSTINPNNSNYVQPFLNPLSSTPNHLLNPQSQHNSHHHHPYLFNNTHGLHHHSTSTHSHHHHPHLNDYGSSPSSLNETSEYHHKNEFKVNSFSASIFAREIEFSKKFFHFSNKNSLI